MKKAVSMVAVVGMLGLGMSTGEASAAKKPGNENDGCQIGNIPGHKDHGQSNEHKIDYMTKAEWEAYLIANNYVGQQISNNEGKDEEIEDKEEVENSIPMLPLEPSAPVTPDEEKKEDTEDEIVEDETDSIPVTPIESSTPVIPEEGIDEDLEEVQPDPGPMGEMGRPEHDPDSPLYQPDPGPMGEMGRPKHNPDFKDKIIDEEMCEDIHQDSPTTEEEWAIVHDPELEEAIRKENLSKENPSEDLNIIDNDYENPKTGDGSLFRSFGTLAAAMTTLFVVNKRVNKRKED